MSDAPHSINLDTNEIKDWRSIITLIVFVLTNIFVLFPFHIPLYVPRSLWIGFLDAMSGMRLTPPQNSNNKTSSDGNAAQGVGRFKRFSFPVNFVTAPLIADFFLLAILAIGRTEVHDGTIGANNIFPIDIMAFFLTLAYIAISIDASGLIRYLAFKILQRGGKYGHWLYFYLYLFFFALASFVGNDPIVLSGTAFLAYMTRISDNIKHPRAWIHMQFATANIGSAILVSSNPTNLVLAGAFEIKYIVYAGNVVVPVVVTAIVLFPFLLYVIFPYESLIPSTIKLHELPEDRKEKKPVNPNIPQAAMEDDDEENDEQVKLAHLEEIMNPFLDKGGAAFGAVIMAVTLVTILAVNASSQRGSETPIYWITCPAAFVMFCWDVTYGWRRRKETREIAQTRREEALHARARRIIRNEDEISEKPGYESEHGPALELTRSPDTCDNLQEQKRQPHNEHDTDETFEMKKLPTTDLDSPHSPLPGTSSNEEIYEKRVELLVEQLRPKPAPKTLQSLMNDGYRYCQETCPTVTVVAAHLPWALVPFAFCMFVLVQALVTKGWVPVFAHGWDHWIDKTGTVGAVGGMAFLGVVLCNFAGTNIGTTILLCRVVQAWVEIHQSDGVPIPQRTFWATVYSMAIAVNYGAFSTAFSASLAGLLWRDILSRKHIQVKALDFARVNLPIITITMVVGCVVLIGEVYLVRDMSPYTG